MTLEPLPIRELLRDYGLKPKKGLGQNFLVDDDYLIRIVESAEIRGGDEVLEIGAGLGSLTRYLAATAKRVTAVEIDDRMHPVLENVLKDFTNIQLIIGDIMELGFEKYACQSDFKVVANIPYYLTSNLIRRLLEMPRKPISLALTIQYEVAERVCATPGDMSLLALGVQVYGKPQIAFKIPAKAFYPVPKVDSALLFVKLHESPIIPADSLEFFFKLAKAAFMQKRKMLHNALAGAPGLSSQRAGELLEISKIAKDRRPQTLSLDEWHILTEKYREIRSL